MTAIGGRQYLAIPGPSIMPDRVLRAMHRPAPNIYAGELVDMAPQITAGLCDVARTRGDVAIYIGNGHAVWEASLANTLAPGDKVLVPATGFFGPRWGEIAQALGIEVQGIDFGRQSPVDMDQFSAVLADDKAHKIKAVLATHVDTSTTVRNDIAKMREAMDAVNHPAMLMVDCIASLGCDRFEMDAWGVDVMVAASQKGLMTPPGLGFVFLNDKAKQARSRLTRVSRYWDWVPRIAPNEFYQYFCGTAPTHHLYGLNEALIMLAEEGIEAVWARHERLARAVWTACDTWGEGGALRANIADPAHRSRAVTALSLDPPQGARLRHWLERNAGVTLGIGLGMSTEQDPEASGAFRIGHMGHMNAHGMLGVLASIEAGMSALSIPRGAGAADAAAASLAVQGV